MAGISSELRDIVFFFVVLRRSPGPSPRPRKYFLVSALKEEGLSPPPLHCSLRGRSAGALVSPAASEVSRPWRGLPALALVILTARMPVLHAASMFGDKPSGEVVDTWGARRICEMRAANQTVAAIARHFSTSVSTVKSILDEHHTPPRLG